MADHGHNINPDEVAKLLCGLQKTDFMIDIKMTAECFLLIYNKSIEQGAAS